MSLSPKDRVRRSRRLALRWWRQGIKRIFARRSARLFTGLGLVVSALLALGLVFLFYYQQKATLLESTLQRQDRLLHEIERTLQQEMEREVRQTSLMAHVVRSFSPSSTGRERAYGLLSSDSLAWQLVITHRTEAVHMLWKRDSLSKPHLAREFFRFSGDLAISDLGWSRPTPKGDSEPVLSVRFKRLTSWQDLEFVASERGLREALQPTMVNQGFSLGLVNENGEWFPLYGPDTTRTHARYGQELSETILDEIRNQPRGILSHWDKDPTNPFPERTILHARRMRAWGELHWTLVLYGPRADMDRVLLGQLWRFLWVLLFVGLLWGLLSWLLLRREASLGRLHRDIDHLREMRRKDDQLVRAEKLATAGVLMSGLAHEIGTPLGVLSMRLQLLRKRFEDGSEEIKTVDILLGQLDRVTGLIRQLLDFARSKPMPEHAVDLGQILSTLESLLTPMANRKGARIEIEAAPGMIVSGTEDGLQQVFLNLSINAIQAMENPDGLLRIRVMTVEEGFVVAVEDNGPGIPEERRNAIFDPFFTTKKQGEGSGLGLTVVLDLVHRMGGEMRVGPSAELGGARFDVELRRWDGTAIFQHA
ncbi:MAG: hypothetical protein RL318_1603 [Fibrobacterota bacterium]|jgi:signal transduction histidine kinase